MLFPHTIWQVYFAAKIFAVVIAFSTLVVLPSVAQAELPFIDQIPSGVTINIPSNSSPLLNQYTVPGFVSSFAPGRQFAAPHLSAANLASLAEIGNGNNAGITQNGGVDEAAVGIIGGNNNNVGILQNGNNLQSNLLLLGTKGMSVGVIQPNGSAPVNMAIIHVPAGTVIIPHL